MSLVPARALQAQSTDQTRRPPPASTTVRWQRTVLLAALACCVASREAAAAGGTADVAALEARIKALEARLAVLEGAQAPAPSANADARVDALSQDLKVVQRKLELKDEEAATAAANTPVVTAGEKGFALASRDGNFSLRLRGLIQVDSRDYGDDGSVAGSTDTFLFRRVRPILEGTVFGNYDYRFVSDFAGGKVIIQDAYVDARLDPAAKLRVGKFKTPFGLERLQSANDIRFAERALPNNLVPNRDLGVQLSGDLFGGKLSYAVAALNGVADGASSDAIADTDNNGDKDLAARVFAQPFLDSDHFLLRGLGFGVAATYVDQTGSAATTLLPTYKSPGQLTVFSYRGGTTATFGDGERLRFSPQASYYAGSFGLLGEYVRVSQEVSRNLAGGRRSDRLDHDAWQLAATYALTGEEESFKELKPAAPFRIGGEGWGAVELVARASALELDRDAFTGGAASFADPAVAVREAKAYAVGVNWYWNRNLKWVFDLEKTRFDGGAAGGRDRPDETVITSRLQIAF